MIPELIIEFSNYKKWMWKWNKSKVFLVTVKDCMMYC